MSKSRTIFVYYSFQLEECPEMNILKYVHPDADSPILIKNIINAFPFDTASGLYHYRFKSEFKEGTENIVAWIDISNLSSKAPLYNNAIYVKILKLAQPTFNKTFSQQKLTAAALSKRASGSDAPPSMMSQSVFVPKSTPPINDSKARIAASPPPAVAMKKQQSRTFSQSTSPVNSPHDSAHSPSSIPKKQSMIDHNILDMHQPQTTTSAAVPVVLSPTIVTAPSSNGATTEEPQLKPGQYINPNTGLVEQSTEQKLQRFRRQEIEAQKAKDEQHRVRDEVDTRIEKWAYTSKVLNNYRTLLVTVHQVWDYEGWSAVSLGNLLTDDDLKKYYKVASRLFHPDKNRNEEPRRKYMAKRVIQELSEAYKKIQGRVLNAGGSGGVSASESNMYKMY